MEVQQQCDRRIFEFEEVATCVEERFTRVYDSKAAGAAKVEARWPTIKYRWAGGW
jgi:hypothetical protein